MTLEQLAMVYVIEHLAPDPGRSLAGVLLYTAGATVPGVRVEIDWPTFLERPAEEIERMYRERLTFLLGEAGLKHLAPVDVIAEFAASLPGA